MSSLIRFVFCLILLAIVLLGFVFSNYNPTEVPLWIGFELSPQRVGVWLILAFALGGIIGLLLGFGFFRRIKYRVELYQLRAQLKKVEKLMDESRTGKSKGLK